MTQDVHAARAILLEDDEIDALYNKVNRELIALIMADTTSIDHGN